MKIWKPIIALAAACFAGGFWETTAQERLTIEYTLEGVEDVRHELQVEKDVEVLKFEDPPLASLTLPEGLTKLRELEVDFPYSPPLYGPTSLTLPEELISLEELTLWQCRFEQPNFAQGIGAVAVCEAYRLAPLSFKPETPRRFGEKCVSPDSGVSIYWHYIGAIVCAYKYEGVSPKQAFSP